MPMAVQLMTNVKLWSTVTRGGGDTVIIGDPDSNFVGRPLRYKASLTASCLVAHVLAVVLAVALEGPGDALVPGGALPLVIPTRGARGRGAAVRLVTAVTAVIITVTPPGLQNTLLVGALVFIWLTQTVLS